MQKLFSVLIITRTYLINGEVGVFEPIKVMIIS